MPKKKKIVKKVKKKFSQKQIEQFKKDLGLGEDTIKHLNEVEEIEKSAKLVNKNAGKKGWASTDVIVYRDPPKKKNKNTKTSRNSNDLSSDDPQINLNNIRREVHAFALKGFDKDKRKDARIRQLVKLGADPPKGPSLNIKELKEKKFHEKQEEKNKKETEKNLGYKISSISAGAMKKRRSKKDKNDIGALDGQVGRHRGGITKLSKRDITSISGKKHKR
ncbi:unnamed protein product [Dimorphilus gyrociliatus]|uniref:Uncharacterized protein n=1 Tax=Dimorphilus gyrociliatus TaxID=2664684 RepID=A0A7I8VT61_9ANNE|nr:unnamed protein product [Dimorphilus gyrociliatus]